MRLQPTKIGSFHSSPFGVTLSERDFTSEKYRYGFNGMEKDDEVKGKGNSYDFGARIYDNRLGRFLSIDPHFVDYPALSQFVFSFNSPNLFNDKSGLDGKVTVQKNPNGGGEITISSVVYITGKGADSKKAEYLTQRAAKMYKTKTIQGEDGNSWTVRFDVKFEYNTEKNETNLEYNENIIVSADKIGRSHVKGGSEKTKPSVTKYEDGSFDVETQYIPTVGKKVDLDSKEFSGVNSIVSLHEVFHLLGFDDRYDDIDEDGDGDADKSIPHDGFKSDLMGNTSVGVKVVDEHYKNIIKTYGVLDSGDYKLKYYVDKPGESSKASYSPGETEGQILKTCEEIKTITGAPEKVENK